MKLDLGCGKNKKEGYIGIDKIDYSTLYSKGEFIQADIDKEELPIKNNTIQEVYTRDFLEHTQDLTHVLEEIHRVTKNNAQIKIQVPHFNISIMDNFHVRHFSYSLAFWNTYGNYNFKTTHKKAVCTHKNIFLWRHIIEKILNIHPRILWVFEFTNLKYLLPPLRLEITLQTIK